ncbi:hypothetical protein [Mesorhizobium sp. M0910]|uniref:hypothetical protein n=1 Tax=Mesorhizobium sp. M0910 TaxID=2957025 RepID=UPI00333CD768
MSAHRKMSAILLQSLENGDIDPVQRHFRDVRKSCDFSQRLSKRAIPRKRIRKHLRNDSWFTTLDRE